MSMIPQSPNEIEILGEKWDIWLKIPKNIWKEIGWELNDEASITVCKEYDKSGNFSHKSICVESEKYYKKRNEE